MFENQPSPVPPEEEPVTSRDEAGEPSGDEDPAVEREILEEKEAAESGTTDSAADPLAAMQRERDEYLDLARRTQADFENYRKRAARETAASGERAKSGLVRELLPVVDNLERALSSQMLIPPNPSSISPRACGSCTRPSSPCSSATASSSSTRAGIASIPASTRPSRCAPRRAPSPAS